MICLSERIKAGPFDTEANRAKCAAMGCKKCQSNNSFYNADDSFWEHKYRKTMDKLKEINPETYYKLLDVLDKKEIIDNT